MIGDLVIDDAQFTTQVDAPGFESRPELDASYRAPNGGVGFQFNQFVIQVKPNKRAKRPPHVTLSPAIAYFELENSAVTTRRGAESITVQTRALPQEAGRPARLKVIVSGKISRRHKGLATRRRVAHPLEFSGAALLDALAQVGVKSSGVVRRGQTPPELTRAQPTATHTSPHLTSLLHDINVFSNNYMAEQLLLAMSLKRDRRATWAGGQRVVRSYLDDNLGLEGYTYHNGSGLFGDTAFSPHMLTEVLLSVDQTTEGAFAKTLPVAGREGTLKRRLRDLPRGVFRGKTGTLDGVSSLCGYLKTRARQRFVLCVIVNEHQSPTWKVRQIQDEMVRLAWRLRVQKSAQKSAQKIKRSN